MKHLLKSYLQITAVMAINVGLVYAVLTLRFPGSGPQVDGAEVENGENVNVERNLNLLTQKLFEGYHANLRHILDSCGSPDGYMGQIDGDLELIYYYNRFGTKDWVAYVTLKNGFLTDIGYNGATVNDHSDFIKWAFSDKDIPTYR